MRKVGVRILLVEDEPSIRDVVRFHLELAGYEVEESGHGRQALDRLRAEAFGLVILDVMLPGLDGISLCRAMRTSGPNTGTPVLMLTARDTESDTVLGLESGADDYVTKPFGVRELTARVQALLRRQARGDTPDDATPVTASRDIQLDVARREAVVRGVPIELTRQEFDVLLHLMSRPGIVFSRTALLRSVWGGDTYVTERTVDTVVSRLRRKVEQDAQDPGLILTSWGVGYKFADVD